MSQESSINDLNNSISDEDSRLVDSILNDLNGSEKPSQRQQQMPQQMPQQVQGEQQQLTPEQIKNIQMQRQMAMQQQQQMMMQQQKLAQQQNASNNSISENITIDSGGDIIENIKKEAKSIILVILLSVILNLEQVDNVLKMQPNLFVTEGGTINIQGTLIKGIIVGVLYYVIKTYVF